MTVIELRDELNKLMKEMPNTINDDISYLDDCELLEIDKLSIEFDIENIGRYIVLK